MSLLVYVPLAAFLVSAGFNIRQYLDRQRDRRPRVLVDANEAAGAPSWPDRHEGAFTGPAAAALYVAGTIHVAGSAIITDVRLAPATGDAVWESMPEPDVYVADPAQPDTGRREAGMGIAQFPDEFTSHRLPQPLTDAQLVIRVEYAEPHLPGPLNRHEGARLWVQTDTGHRYLSPVGTLRTRWRGPRPVSAAIEGSENPAPEG